MAAARPRTYTAGLTGLGLELDRESSTHTSGGRGSGLARLVSKYETLNAGNSLPQPTRCMELPAKHADPTSANTAGVTKPKASMTPSKSAGSFPATRGTTAGFGLSLRQVPSALTSGDSSSARSTASGVDRVSMVAERRRFFEGPQARKLSCRAMAHWNSRYHLLTGIGSFVYLFPPRASRHQGESAHGIQLADPANGLAAAELEIKLHRAPAHSGVQRAQAIYIQSSDGHVLVAARQPERELYYSVDWRCPADRPPNGVHAAAAAAGN